MLPHKGLWDLWPKLHTYQAKWVKTESTEQPTTSVLIARNSSILSLKAMISVGQTNVL